MSPADSDRPPRELIVAGVAIAVILAGIFIAVAVLYRPPPLASPFGCYNAPGRPLVRLSARSIYVEGQVPPERAVVITREKNGYSVLAWPSFWYVGPPQAQRLASPDMLPQWSGLVLESRPEDIPQISMLVGGSLVDAPKIKCPPSRLSSGLGRIRISHG